MVINESSGQALPGEMQEAVKVIALRPFHLGDERIEVGVIVQVSKARAEYLRFLGLADMDVSKMDT